MTIAKCYTVCVGTLLYRTLIIYQNTSAFYAYIYKIHHLLNMLDFSL